jgi:tetratricopeptide (TPR) repeat protein
MKGKHMHSTKFSRLLVSVAIGAAAVVGGAERFDYLVRADFFAGFGGDRVAFDRAMKTCEDALAGNPKHAEAMVWHGSGTFFLSGQAFQKGDFAKGGELWERGLGEMDQAAALAPESVGVLIPRGATLLTATRSIPGPERMRPLLEKGVADYEKVYRLQQPYFDKLSGHARGELLFGLAEGNSRLGNKDAARLNFERLLAVGPTSGHEPEAKQWLATGSITSRQVSCSGCHTK